MTRNAGVVLLSFVRNAAIAFGGAGILYFFCGKDIGAWAAAHWLNELILLGGVSLLLLVGYLIGSWCLRASESRELFALIRRRIRK